MEAVRIQKIARVLSALVLMALACNIIILYLAPVAVVAQELSDGHGLLTGVVSYDTLSQLERLDQSAPAWTYEVDDLYAPSGETLADVIAQRRAAAQADCSDWRSWSLSAFLAAGGGA